MSTIVVRGATKNVMDEIERAVDDGVNVFKTLTKDARLVAGAGAVEMELYSKLLSFAEETPGLEQYAIRKFAEAFLVVPRMLAESSGLIATDVISTLTAAHQEGKKNAGVDLESSDAIDAVTEGIFDCFATKYWAIRYATDAALTILNVDQIIMARPAGYVYTMITIHLTLLVEVLSHLNKNNLMRTTRQETNKQFVTCMLVMMLSQWQQVFGPNYVHNHIVLWQYWIRRRSVRVSVGVLFLKETFALLELCVNGKNATMIRRTLQRYVTRKETTILTHRNVNLNHGKTNNACALLFPNVLLTSQQTQVRSVSHQYATKSQKAVLFMQQQQRTPLRTYASSPASAADEIRKFSSNPHLAQWVQEQVSLCQPDRVHVCDGTQQEYDALCEEMVQSGTFTRLNEKKRPNSFLARSTEDDVARLESRTFICSKNKEDAGYFDNMY